MATSDYKTGDRVRVIGIDDGEVMKVRHDSTGDAIYTVHLDDGTLYYARDVEIRRIDRLCANCQKSLARHGPFARCDGGLTQYDPWPKPMYS